MNKTKLSLALTIVGALFVAGNFAACGSKSSGGGGAAGSTGAAGSGTHENATDPNDPTKCVTGAYPRGTPPVCACQDQMPNVCPTIGCTDKQTDPDNCGTCGNKCAATSTCIAGTCGPAVKSEVAAITGCTALKLASNGTKIFYADEGHGTINQVGGAAALVTGEMAPTWLAAAGGNLFWYSKTTKTIRKAAQAGGAASDVYKSATDEIGGFAVTTDGATIYFSAGTDVSKVAAAGGAATVVVHEAKMGVPRAIAIDGTSHLVFPTDQNADVDAPKLMPAASPAVCGMEDAMMNVIMTDCERLGRSQGSLLYDTIFAIGGKAVWADGMNIKIESVMGGGETFDVIAMTGNSVTSMAPSPDGKNMYIGEDGFIDKVPTAKNSTLVQIARGQMAPTSIAVDGSRVYWGTADCAINSTAQ
jgi:hypothetical protein